MVRHGKRRWKYVSIRSPHRGEGRSGIKTYFERANDVSIRSPHRGEGRLGRHKYLHESAFVSIRSPHRGEGRSMFAVSFSEPLWFQSAPLTEARGDA